MSYPDPSLEQFVNRFKSWKQGKTHTKYPQAFWDEICSLAKHIPIATIAQALGINVYYLKTRIAKLNKDCVTLAPIKISYPASFCIEFQSKNDKTVTIRFQASLSSFNPILELNYATNYPSYAYLRSYRNNRF